MSDLAKRIADLSPEKKALLSQRLKKRRTGPGDVITRRPQVGAFPLSFAQQRLWFLDQLTPNNPLYNIPAALRLSGRLDEDAFHRSLNAIVGRHEILRARFIPENGRPVQLIAPEVNLPLPVLDLRGMSKTARDEEAIRVATEEANRPFSLENGPLIRAGLIRMAEEEHIALLTMHHIVSDGWSIGVLTRELSLLYKAFAYGDPAELPELPFQYADYAWWQRDRLQGDSIHRPLEFWKHWLNGAPSMLHLPTDRPRPSMETYRGAILTFDVPRPLSEKLKALARDHDATLFMVLLAAFRILLYRYTGQEDICIGTPVANRNRAEIEGLIGLFVNSLVMRNDLAGNPTFTELLQRERNAALEAYAHQELPFEQVVEALRPHRNLSYAPLFQVMFVLQDDPLRVLELPDLKCELLEIDRGSSKFDLTLFMEDGSTGMKGALEYNTDLFHPSTIRQMASCLQVLLHAIASDPDQKVDTLPLLREESRRALLAEWAGATTDYPRDETVDRLFDAQARQTPDSVAVVFGQDQITYRQLNDQTDRLAEILRALGIGPEMPVGILMDRSIEMIVAHLGILKAGGAYLPLDPAYPPERLRYMIKDSRAKIILTQKKFRIPNSEFRIPNSICLDTDWPMIAQGPDSNPGVDVSPLNLAYVMYTSGSTGVPKGVRVIHRGVVRLVKNTDYATMGADEVFLQLAPISFDAATLEIWGPLLNGGRLVVPPPGSPSLAEIGDAIQRYGVTSLWLTSALFHMMVDERLEAMRGLHQLLAGGDVLSASHVQKVLDGLPGVRMINGYGPTENTTFSSCYLAAGRMDGPVPVGRPVANTWIYILDRNMRPVPPGVPGELFVGGDGLARDYLNQPGLTAERFVPHPFPRERGGGERLYRTGDLARFLKGGDIGFLGRMDSQVKIRGFRIEPQEIESVLARHPDVKEAVVLALQDGPGDKRLAAYFVPRQGLGPGSAELRSHVKQTLPEYMVPSSYIRMEALPITPSGKIDRRALPIPERTRPDAGASFVAPRNPTEQILAKIWSEVLKMRQVGIFDDFFELGGHSLIATQIVSRIRDAFQVDLPVRDLFQTPTIAGLAQRLEAFRWALEGRPDPAQDPFRREEGEL